MHEIKSQNERFTVTIHEFIFSTSFCFGFLVLGLIDDSQTWCIQNQGLEGLALDPLLNSRIEETLILSQSGIEEV